MKYAWFTLIYIISIYGFYLFIEEIQFLLDYVNHYYNLFINSLELELKVLLALLLSFFFKTGIFIILVAFKFIKWFFFMMKLNWINLVVFLPFKTFVLFVLKSLTFIVNLQDELKDLIKKIWSDYKSWSLLLKIYSMPAVFSFFIIFIVGIFFTQAIQVMLTNKLGYLVFEKTFLFLVKRFPSSQRIFIPVRNKITNIIKKIENNVQ